MDRANELIVAAEKLRLEHKRMGCRKLYHELNPEGLGRDRTEAILLANGFRVKRKRNRYRTTYAGKYWYQNHITGMRVTGINQLWVSDITYLLVSKGKHYFLTLIQDVYSRKIVGWCLSQGMRSDQTVVPAYQMAMKKLNLLQSQGLVFHSDKGSQYYWKELDRLHRQYGVTPSMGGKAWENAHAESINGILKNEYLDFEGPDISYSQAKGMVAEVVKKYNEKRPHGSLNNMKPVEFENYIKSLNTNDKPIVEINY